MLSLKLVLLAATYTPVRADGDPILIGAGDIASCALDSDEFTARLIDAEIAAARETGRKIVVFTAGDNVYPNGTAEEFERCYGPTWGRFRQITRPTLGNHDYATPGAKPFFAYFGENVPGSYYSYRLGEWLILALNSNIDARNGQSPQSQWLRQTLAENPTRCALAYFHHPIHSSHVRERGTLPRDVRAIWEVLYEFGVDVVVNGDIHTYERLAPLAPDGSRDDARGIRPFIAGTGGASLSRPSRRIHPHSEAQISQVWGVLKFVLRPNSYTWEFIPISSQARRDAGSATCN